MTSTGGTGVAIAELVFYTPALFIGLWLAIRHGFWRSSGVSTHLHDIRGRNPSPCPKLVQDSRYTSGASIGIPFSSPFTFTFLPFKAKNSLSGMHTYTKEGVQLRALRTLKSLQKKNPM